MGKYLIHGSFTQRGVQGVLNEGGSARRKAVEETVSTAGGTLEAFYFAFGGTDLYCIVDLPSDEVATAISLTISAAGAFNAQITVLLTPELLDAASKQQVNYTPPGG